MLLNVVGGFGVLEGAGGDLRPGLPRQSVFEGERRVHEPLRLSVFIEAGRSKIDAALVEAPEAAQLFTNDWAYLFALEDGECHRRTEDGWVRVV